MKIARVFPRITVSKFLGLALVVIFCVAVAQASPFDLVVNIPDRTGNPGDSFLFQGTITNNTNDVVDQDSLFLNFSNFDFLNLNLTDLLSSDTFTLNPGDTSGVLDLFTADLSSTAPPGTYLADVFVQNAVGDETSDSVTVSISTPTTTPEPSALILMTPAVLFGLKRMASGKGWSS